MRNLIKIAIVEDNEKEAEILTGFIKNFESENSHSFKIERFTDANYLLQDYRPIFDIIFMDIMMLESNGMEAAKKIREVDKVVTLIFITNMAKFAVQGYEVDALDFILKPVKYSSFEMKFRKAISKTISNRGTNVTVSKKGGDIFLSTKQICYIEVSGHKLTYHLLDGTIEGNGSLSKLEKELAEYNFLKSNSCYLVNPIYIVSINGHTLKMMNGDEILISHPRRKKFMQQLADVLGAGK